MSPPTDSVLFSALLTLLRVHCPEAFGAAGQLAMGSAGGDEERREKPPASEEEQAPSEEQREKTGEDRMKRTEEDGRRRRSPKSRAHRGFSKPPPVPRCRRCQQTSHGTADCSSQSKACAVCAEPHDSDVCFDRLRRGETVARRCALCGASGHSAPSLYCPLRPKTPPAAPKTTQPSRTSDDDADRPHAPDHPRRTPQRRLDIETVASPAVTRDMARRRAATTSADASVQHQPRMKPAACQTAPAPASVDATAETDPVTPAPAPPTLPARRCQRRRWR